MNLPVNATLPPELWREIIELATTFLTYFDLISNPADWPDSVRSGPSADYKDHLNTRKSLKLTSRGFSTIVDEFPLDVIWISGTDAYRVEKELRRWFSTGIGGSASQSNVASSNQQPRRFRIRHLFLHHKITHRHNSYEGPHWDLHDLYCRIFQSCPDLSGFCYVNSTPLSPYNGMLANAIADEFPNQLRYIHWSARSIAGSHSRFFHRVAHSLRAFRVDGADTSGSLRNEVSLPVLTHFDTSSTDLDLEWISEWKLPSITHVTVGDISPPHVLSKFLASAKLTLISIRITFLTTSLPVEKILAGAPNLQELSYYISHPDNDLAISPDWTSDLRHQSLQRVKIEFAMYTRAGLLNYVHPINKQCFPMLKTLALELPAASMDRASEPSVTAFLSENLDLSNHPISIATN